MRLCLQIREITQREKGIFQTEYLWHHSLVFEDVIARTEPVLIPVGLTSAGNGQASLKNIENACCNKDRADGIRVYRKMTSPVRATGKIGQSRFICTGTMLQLPSHPFRSRLVILESEMLR